MAIFTSVYAYEPNPNCCGRLQSVWQKVTVVKAALSDAPGSAVLKIPNYRGVECTGLLPSHRTSKMQMESKSFQYRCVDWMTRNCKRRFRENRRRQKKKVLRGAMQFLKSQKPNILEVTPKLYENRSWSLETWPLVIMVTFYSMVLDAARGHIEVHNH
jgi:hypothetical protein